MATQTLDGGFRDPALDAAKAFRGLMNAMARPGTIHDVTGAAPPEPLSVAAGTALLTLCDAETPLFLSGVYDVANIRDWVTFHTGASLVGPAHCMFALGRWQDLVPLSAYPVGTPEYPDRSATLIVETQGLAQSGATLSGPGIRDTAELALPDIAALQGNHALYPLGLDFLFTEGDRIAALPRSTEVH